MEMVVVALATLYGAVLGGAFASFACVVSERVPAGVSVRGRSACACGRQLRAAENIPVLGWVRTWGRARCCGGRVPARYVLAEASLAVLVAGFGARAGVVMLGGGNAGAAWGWALAVAALGAVVVAARTWQSPTDGERAP